MQSPATTPEDRLKELLLEEELALLSELEKRLEQLHFRVGDESALRLSVGRVIVDALRDAGVAEHDRLAAVLAPLIIQSLQAEIRNSREMMVDALYPITGRLVAAAVRNAFRDLLESLDERLNDTLSFDRLKIRVQALVTRSSAAELMLKKYPPFALEELLVIQRSSGILISHWIHEDNEGEGVDSDLVGGMLSAIMSFTRDAFGEHEQGELDNLEFGGATLFIRASPVLVVAVKARGTPPHGFDAGLDSLFVDYVETWGKAVADPDALLDESGRSEMVADLHRRLTSLLARPRKKSLSEYRNAFVLLGLVALLLLGWGLEGWLDAREVRRVEGAARAVVASQSRLVGYPMSVHYERDPSVLQLTGLVPDPQTLAGLREALAAAVPEATIDLEPVGVIPQVELPTARPTATDLLTGWVGRAAVYFSRDTEPRDPEAADRLLDAAARNLLATPSDVRLRVVGYADATGGAETNRRVTESRAHWVADALVARGVPRERLVLVAGVGGQDLLAEPGEGSDNRRVEFDVTYARK